MSGDDDVVIRRSKKKNLLGVFGKRQSRIEPDDSGDDHLMVPKLTPSKALNRLSGNFTFCFSANAAATLSPTDLDEVPIVRPKIRPRDHLKLDLDQALLDQMDPRANGKVEVNLQKPITESRSRFRNRYLPNNEPVRVSLAVEEVVGVRKMEQHFSNPDIPQMVPNSDFSERKSLSSDAIHNVAKGPESRPASADSLARHALMAAQVLHLIPTEKARQRNFFQGQLGANPLLGPNELDRVLHNREIKVFVGTWNMNGQNPPSQLNDLVFPNRMEHVPDIIALGTQESCSERFEWEVLLQETLGPSHVLLHSAYLGTLHLAIFLRRDLIWFCSLPEDDSFSVRPGTAFRTKGAVAISFCLFGTSMLFITSHLTAHQAKVKERVQDVKRIIHALDLPRNLNIRHKNKDVTTNFDMVFFCGDLNFRLSEPRANLLRWIESTSFPLPEHLPHGFMHTDQLTQALSDCAAFKGFREAKITFPPTYKYDPGTQQFDTSSKQRAPAYTDRILYKFRWPNLPRRNSAAVMAGNNNLPVIPLAYDSVNSIVSSDHKPVWALFKCQIRPGIDSVPLAAGLFNRDIYLEGMKRRLRSNDSESSAVCSIQ